MYFQCSRNSKLKIRKKYVCNGGEYLHDIFFSTLREKKNVLQDCDYSII